jgi:hypothetical protein
MYEVIDQDGKPVLMADGVTPFRYRDRELAERGRGILQGRKGETRRLRIREVKP